MYSYSFYINFGNSITHINCVQEINSWLIYLPYNEKSKPVQMPRIHALHIILEYNLKPPLVVPSRNKSAIDRNRIGGMNWEFVELVHA